MSLHFLKGFSFKMASGVHLTDRDLLFLGELGTVGLMDTPMVRARHYSGGTSDRYCLRRLREHSEEGLIECIPITINHGNGPKKLPSVYRLTEKGADRFETTKGKRPPRVARSDPPSPTTIRHRLGVVQVILSLKDACVAAGIPFEFILEQDTNSGLDTAARA
jgi:hypothetical protein